MPISLDTNNMVSDSEAVVSLSELFARVPSGSQNELSDFLVKNGVTPELCVDSSQILTQLTIEFEEMATLFGLDLVTHPDASARLNQINTRLLAMAAIFDALSGT